MGKIYKGNRKFRDKKKPNQPVLLSNLSRLHSSGYWETNETLE